MPNAEPPLPMVVPDPAKPFTAQDPVVLLGMCVWGEARNQEMEAKIGVACVVRNRVGFQGKYGDGFRGVILKPHQFSSFNPNDPNRQKLLHPLAHDSEAVWQACLTAAHIVYWGTQSDVTHGAIFYYSRPLKAPPTRKDGTSAWGDIEHCIDIDGLSFWKEARK